MFKLIKNVVVFLSLIIAVLVVTPKVKAASNIAGGDFFQGFNNTTQQGTWRDPVDGSSGQIIEFRIIVHNSGDAPAERVQVWGTLNGQVPQDPSNQQVLTARIANAAFGGGEVTDTVTVNILGHPEGLRYVPRHARLQGVTSLFNCPSACDIPDNIVGGIGIGDVAAGDRVELAYKVSITNTVVTATLTPTTPPATATPTPTTAPAATATPTPTTSVSSPGIGGTLQCPAGFTATIVGTNMICIQNNNNNTNNNTNTQNQTQTNNQSVNITNSSSSTASAPQGTVLAAASTLPKTGLPLTVWGLMSLVPIGLKVRKFAKGFGKDASDSPNYIWEERQFKK